LFTNGPDSKPFTITNVVNQRGVTACPGPADDLVLTKTAGGVTAAYGKTEAFNVNLNAEDVYLQVRSHLSQDQTAALVALRIMCQEFADGRLSVEDWQKFASTVASNIAGVKVPISMTAGSAETKSPAGIAVFDKKLVDEIHALALTEGVFRRTREAAYHIDQDSSGRFVISTVHTTEIENSSKNKASYTPFVKLTKTPDSTRDPTFKIGRFLDKTLADCVKNERGKSSSIEFECQPQEIPVGETLRIRSDVVYPPVVSSSQIIFADVDVATTLVKQSSQLSISYPKTLKDRIEVRVQPLMPENGVVRSLEEEFGSERLNYIVKGPLFPYQGFYIEIRAKHASVIR
jgi:hypothetical protein